MSYIGEVILGPGMQAAPAAMNPEMRALAELLYGREALSSATSEDAYGQPWTIPGDAVHMSGTPDRRHFDPIALDSIHNPLQEPLHSHLKENFTNRGVSSTSKEQVISLNRDRLRAMSCHAEKALDNRWSSDNRWSFDNRLSLNNRSQSLDSRRSLPTSSQSITTSQQGQAATYAALAVLPQRMRANIGPCDSPETGSTMGSQSSGTSTSVDSCIAPPPTRTARSRLILQRFAQARGDKPGPYMN